MLLFKHISDNPVFIHSNDMANFPIMPKIHDNDDNYSEDGCICNVCKLKLESHRIIN